MAENMITRIINDKLEKHVDRRAQQWSRQFGVHEDASPDVLLAHRINREVHRRGAIGRQLDIYEPLLWTGESFLLSAAVGVGIKATTEKSFAKPALVTLLVSTALMSGIQLVRLLPRYDAGLRGGVDTARCMHDFDQKHASPADSWANRVQDTPVGQGLDV